SSPISLLYLLWYLVTIPSHVITYGITLTWHLFILPTSLAKISYFLYFSSSTFWRLSWEVMPTSIINTSFFLLSKTTMSGLLWDMLISVRIGVSTVIFAQLFS